MRNELYDITLTDEDVKKATENVSIEADSSTKETVNNVVGTGNTIIANYMEEREGVDATSTLNSGIVRVSDELDGALGTYEPHKDRTNILRKYITNPLHALTIYAHEAVHKTLDKVFGYGKTLKSYVDKTSDTDPFLALLIAEYGNALNEGLTDAIRLRTVGRNGIVSTYEKKGFVGAALYALRRSGGKIYNLVKRLPEAIDDFASALMNPQLAYS